jgi:predicted RNA binding protein YcfA (HicA-like mRNA interferase family)
MIKTPRVTGKKLIAALKKLGFIQTRKKGSHCFLKHPDGRCTVVTGSFGRDYWSRVALQYFVRL